MSELLTAITTGLTAFSATNIDNLVILMLFFTQINATFQRQHILVGLYLGFSAMLAASLPGFFGGLILPQTWIALLGFVPIAIGLSRLLKHEEDSPQLEVQTGQSERSITSFFSAQTYSVAAIMFANGSDNIGVYIPLFANSDLESLVIILSVFLLLLGVVYYFADKFTRQPAIADVLTRHGNTFVPFVLIGLGVFIVWESVTLTLLSVVASSLLWLMTLGRNHEREPQIAEH